MYCGPWSARPRPAPAPSPFQPFLPSGPRGSSPLRDRGRARARSASGRLTLVRRRDTAATSLARPRARRATPTLALPVQSTKGKRVCMGSLAAAGATARRVGSGGRARGPLPGVLCRISLGFGAPTAPGRGAPHAARQPPRAPSRSTNHFPPGLLRADLERTLFAERAFQIFDEDKSGLVDFREFIMRCVCACHARRCEPWLAACVRWIGAEGVGGASLFVLVASLAESCRSASA